MPRLAPGAWRARLVLVALALTCAMPALAAPASASKRRVGWGFMGVNWTGGTPAPTLDTAPFSTQRSEAKRMSRSGVESIRVAFHWHLAQPYPRWSQVPPSRRHEFVNGPGGVPTSFAETDRYVRLTAERRIRLLPFVIFAPRWASLDPRAGNYYTKPGLNYSYYTNYLTALVQRYGPNGTFWSQNPRVPKRPVREWQVWHEPNIGTYWTEQPYARYYVPLLRASYRALHAADPGVRVVLAGLPNRSWDVLDQLYQAGAHGWFDVLAIHPFSNQVSNVIKVVELSRQVAARYGDARRPMYLTELAWSTAGGHIPTAQLTGIEVTSRQQNARLKSLYGQLAKQRRLGINRAYWVTWATTYRTHSHTWDYTGLVGAWYVKPLFRPVRLLSTYTGVARRLEGCKKSDVATRCARKPRKHKHKRRKRSRKHR